MTQDGTGREAMRRLDRRRVPSRPSWRGLRADPATTWRLIRAYLRGDDRDVRLRSVLAVVVGFRHWEERRRFAAAPAS